MSRKTMFADFISRQTMFDFKTNNVFVDLISRQTINVNVTMFAEN
jgi:hypothetical protein